MSQLYESIFILRPTLADEDVQKALEKVKATAEKVGASVYRLENWGKKKLAYEVKQEKKGIYVQLQFNGNGAAVFELERLFRLDDSVLKFLTVKLDLLQQTAVSANPPVMEPEHGRV